MPAVYSNNLQVYNAQQFWESVSEPNSTNVYFTIGRTSAWANDSAPPQANTSVSTFNEVWKNMIGGKRITSYDLHYCVPRINWQSGVVYTPYDHMQDSLEKNYDDDGFYVLTSDYNVFKCIDNNQGAESTEEPSIATTNDTLTTSDGYVWKFLYTVSPADRLRFMTDDYMPVTQSQEVKAGTIAGAINAIRINDGGTYHANDIILTITGDGTGATAWANVNTHSNTVESISVISVGSGYTYANVELYSANGSNANVSAIISPPGGHGYDILSELGASWVMMNPRLKGSETGELISTGDFRQITLIAEPFIYGTTEIASNTVFSQVSRFTMSGISVDYVTDEIVYQGASLEEATFKAIVVNWDSSNSVIFLSNLEGTPINDSLNGYTSTARKFVSSINQPDLQPLSGRLLYIDNIQPIERASDQTDSFQLVLKF